MWRPISTLPTTRQQVLVTTDESFEDGDDSYSEIELVCCPMGANGQIMNQNSGNYSRAGVWKWWMPVPAKTRSE